MEKLTALCLRDQVRSALCRQEKCFVRFCTREEWLFVSDFTRRHPLEMARERLEGAFEMEEADALLWMRPRAELICPKAGPCQEGTLAARLCLHEKRPITARGMLLLMEALRLQGMKRDDRVLRALAAASLRLGEDSGFFEAGCLLAERDRKKGEENE